MNTRKIGITLAGMLFVGGTGLVQGVTVTSAAAAPASAVTTSGHHHDDDDSDSSDFRDGYRDGYRDGRRAARDDCDSHHGYRYLSHGDRDYMRGYDRGFRSAYRDYC